MSTAQSKDGLETISAEPQDYRFTFEAHPARVRNPEDDTTPDPGVTAWVTGNGRLNGPDNENNNDVDDGATTLLSPPFGEPTILALDLSYDRWYYDDSGGGDFFKAEISNDGGQSWTPSSIS